MRAIPQPPRSIALKYKATTSDKYQQPLAAINNDRQQSTASAVVDKHQLPTTKQHQSNSAMSEDDRSVYSDNDGEQGAPSAKRRRGKAQKWSKVQNFDDTTSFNAWLEGKQGTDWLVKGPKQKTCLGSKQYYKCRY